MSDTVFAWLCEEEPRVLREALRDPYAAMGLYRSLPEAVHAVVLQMLCCPPGTPLHATASLQFERNRNVMEEAVRLGLFTQGSDGWVLHEPFHAALLEGLQAGEVYSAKVGSRLKPAGGGGAGVDLVGREDGYSQWASVLRVLLPTRGDSPSAEVLKTSENNQKLLQELFVKAGFRRAGGREEDALTPEGFQFLMSPAPRQVFALLRTFVAHICAVAGDPVGTDAKSMAIKHRVALFVLSLPFHDASVWYPNFTNKPKENLMHPFALFGVVVYSRSRDEYRVTPLGKLLGLPAGLHVAKRDVVQDGSLIVETNNRVYAYTHDAFRVEMLRLFAAVEMQAEGMTVSRLTRESLQAAFTKKIRGQQIIDYLRANAHPEMADVPDTVLDQILLWESELNRVQFIPAVLAKSARAATIQQVQSLALGIRPDGVLLAQPKALVLAPDVYRRLNAQ